MPEHVVLGKARRLLSAIKQLFPSFRLGDGSAVLQGGAPVQLLTSLEKELSSLNGLLEAPRRIVVLGRPGSGKSTLINATIGSPVLPSATELGTSVITTLKVSNAGTAYGVTVVIKSKEELMQDVQACMTDNCIADLTALFGQEHVDKMQGRPAEQWGLPPMAGADMYAAGSEVVLVTDGCEEDAIEALRCWQYFDDGDAGQQKWSIVNRIELAVPKLLGTSGLHEKVGYGLDGPCGTNQIEFMDGPGLDCSTLRRRAWLRVLEYAERPILCVEAKRLRSTGAVAEAVTQLLNHANNDASYYKAIVVAVTGADALVDNGRWESALAQFGCWNDEARIKELTDAGVAGAASLVKALRDTVEKLAPYKDLLRRRKTKEAKRQRTEADEDIDRLVTAQEHIEWKLKRACTKVSERHILKYVNATLRETLHNGPGQGLLARWEEEPDFIKVMLVGSKDALAHEEYLDVSNPQQAHTCTHVFETLAETNIIALRATLTSSVWKEEQDMYERDIYMYTCTALSEMVQRNTEHHMATMPSTKAFGQAEQLYKELTSGLDDFHASLDDDPLGAATAFTQHAEQVLSDAVTQSHHQLLQSLAAELQPLDEEDVHKLLKGNGVLAQGHRQDVNALVAEALWEHGSVRRLWDGRFLKNGNGGNGGAAMDSYQMAVRDGYNSVLEPIARSISDVLCPIRQAPEGLAVDHILATQETEDRKTHDLCLKRCLRIVDDVWKHKLMGANNHLTKAQGQFKRRGGGAYECVRRALMEAGVYTAAQGRMNTHPLAEQKQLLVEDLMAQQEVVAGALHQAVMQFDEQYLQVPLRAVRAEVVKRVEENFKKGLTVQPLSKALVQTLEGLVATLDKTGTGGCKPADWDESAEAAWEDLKAKVASCKTQCKWVNAHEQSKELTSAQTLLQMSAIAGQ